MTAVFIRFSCCALVPLVLMPAFTVKRIHTAAVILKSPSFHHRNLWLQLPKLRLFEPHGALL